MRQNEIAPKKAPHSAGDAFIGPAVSRSGQFGAPALSPVTADIRQLQQALGNRGMNQWLKSRAASSTADPRSTIQGKFTMNGQQITRDSLVDRVETALRDQNISDSANDEFRRLIDSVEPVDLDEWLQRHGFSQTAVQLGAVPEQADSRLAALGGFGLSDNNGFTDPNRKRKQEERDSSAPPLNAPVTNASTEPNFLGEEPSTNKKGGTRMSRTGSLVRSDSQESLYPIPATSVHRDLRTDNLTNHAAAKKELGNDKVNVFKIAVTMTIRGVNGQPTTYHEIIPEHWNSGLTQVSDKRDTSKELTTYFSDKTEVENLNAKPPPNAFDSENTAKANHSAMWAHSETNAAADPQLAKSMETAVDKILAKGTAGDAVLSATFDGDSAPNSVCTNACRPAIENMRQRLDGIVRAKVKAPIRLSGNFQTDARVSSVKLFQGKQNPDLKEEQRQTNNLDMPPLLGGAVTVEMLPDQRSSMKGRHAFETRRDPKDAKYAMTAADAPNKTTELTQWVQSNRKDALVGKLTDISDQNQAQAAIEALDLENDIPDSLWKTAGEPTKQTENFKRALLYVLWKLLQKDSCISPPDKKLHKDPPSPGLGGPDTGRTAMVH
ncbi:hypothetical protein [Paenibacillus harenae]|uniref:hypothetical protein n=1 Tax=Paenibacillus harenae TaxID=306543 RepID=UPI000429B9EF|nr:hypothetical protein [Paenibacillus harenae]